MTRRLLALDIFRGLTIFFMIVVNTPGSWSHVYGPLLHAKWDGCTPTDLVFPFFIFIVGASMAFSYQNMLKKSNPNWLSKSVKRAFVIFLIGLGLNWFPFYTTNIADLRIFGVLQRIGLAFGGAAIIIHVAKEEWLKYIVAIILLSYWILLYYFGNGDPFSLTGNAVRSLDLKMFGEAHLYHGYTSNGTQIAFDPEGLLSTLPSMATALFGYLIGGQLIGFSVDVSGIWRLSLIGVVSILLGLAWHHLGCPINKPIWSSSYVLFTGGIAGMFLALLIWIIDIRGWDGWTYMFKVFGVNPLVSYALSVLFVKIFFLIRWNGSNLYHHLYVDFFQAYFGDKLGSLSQALWFTLVILFIAHLMYRKRIFVKV